jgi:hypothetical protein
VKLTINRLQGQRQLLLLVHSVAAAGAFGCCCWCNRLLLLTVPLALEPPQVHN